MHLQKAIAILCVPLAMALIGASGLAGKGVGGVQTTGLPPPPTTGSPTSTTGTPTTTTGTPTTSTSGFPTTSTTSGSTGGSTGSGEWAGLAYYHRLYEQQSVPISYKRSGTSVVSATNQHGILLRIVLPGVTVSAPWESTGTAHHVSVFGTGALVSRSDNGAAPVYEAAVPKMGTLTPTTEAGITYEYISAPGHVVVGLTSAAALSGGDLRITVRTITGMRRMVNGVWEYATATDGTYADLDVAKLLCADSAVDTRRGHGQPNLAGELPGDPNAPARPINFGNWDFKGGLFIGNMPVLSGDQSGLARTQLYVPSGGTGALRLATLSLYDFGSPANAVGLSLGTYLPSASDPNLNVGESVVTWDTKWTSIAPRSAAGSPPDNARDPLSTLDLTGVGGDYRNLPLQRTDSLPPTMALSRICLAMTEENVEEGPYWRYFGSKEYAAGSAAFPQNDCAPRVWRLGEDSKVTW